MLVDRYGKNVEVDDWFIRLDQNNEGRLYRVEGYPEPVSYTHLTLPTIYSV